MDNPEVTYDTPEQMLAILGKDVDIYPYLSVCHQAQFIERDVPDDGKFSTFIYLYPYVLPSAETYDERPETIPFTREDLEAFGKDGLDSFHGYWSVHWAAESRQRSDKIHRDDYRSVMSFRSIEFMIRPIADYKKRDDRVVEPRRLYVGWGDIQECARQAAGRPGPMRTFTGVGYMAQPRHVRGRGKEGKEEAKIVFEWRIDRALPERMTFLVDRWKQHSAFKTTGDYRAKMKEVEQRATTGMYNQKLQARDPAATQPEFLFRSYEPQAQPEQDPVPYPRDRKSIRGKRRSKDMSASQELGPSSKRRNVDSQSSRSSQSGSAPQSLTSSPETGRQTPVAGTWQQRTLPLPQTPAYGPWSGGSQSSRSSQSGFASQSPTSSPETGRQTPTGTWSQTTMPPPPPPNRHYTQRSVSSQSSRSSQSGQSFTYSPDVRRQTPVGTWQQGNTPPLPSPQYAQPSYQPSLPAASPRQDQPYAPVPMQHVPAPGSGFAGGQSGGAPSPYLPQAASAHGSYPPGTGNYSTSPSFPSPAMASPGGNVFQYQVPPSRSSSGANYATGPSFQRPAMASPGGNVYQSQGPPPSPQVPPPNSDPGWWEGAGRYMHSTPPHGGNQSGYQGQYGGGRGSGQR